MKHRPDGPISDEAPLSELGLSIRATCACESAGIMTIGQLRRTSTNDLLGLRNIGSTTVREIRACLAANPRQSSTPSDLAQIASPALREYFAAHAPAEPQHWFKPSMPPRPEPVYERDADGKRIHGGILDVPAVNGETIAAYDDERERQRYTQWPWAWADAVLTARGTDEARPAGTGGAP